MRGCIVLFASPALPLAALAILSCCPYCSSAAHRQIVTLDQDGSTRWISDCLGTEERIRQSRLKEPLEWDGLQMQPLKDAAPEL